MTDFDITQPYRYRNGEEVFRTLATDLPGGHPIVTVTLDCQILKHMPDGRRTTGSLRDLVNIPAPKPALPWPRFRPEIGEPYWAIDFCSLTPYESVWRNDPLDRSLASLNLVFPTEAAATAHLQRMLDEAEIRRIVAEFNDGWEGGPGKGGLELYFNHSENDIGLASHARLIFCNPILAHPQCDVLDIARAIRSAIPLDRVARVFGGV